MSPAKDSQLQGDLQLALMHVLWSTEGATVDEARAMLPARFQDGAYTTVQTVLNRLAERGLLERERVGKAFRYRARVSESDYYSSSLRKTLAPVSGEARRTILAQLVGDLGPDELEELDALFQEVRERREA